LAIEIDGDSHFTPTAQAYDEQRTKYIQSFGIMVIRFTNTDIYTNMQKVLDEIAKNLDLP
jgi:very-short-patch-repair endonuclease